MTLYFKYKIFKVAKKNPCSLVPNLHLKEIELIKFIRYVIRTINIFCDMKLQKIFLMYLLKWNAVHEFIKLQNLSTGNRNDQHHIVA